MAEKRFTRVGPVVLICMVWVLAGCVSDSGSIRVRNDTGTNVEQLFVEGVEIGDLAAGQISDYVPVGIVYRTPLFSVNVGGEEIGADIRLGRPEEGPRAGAGKHTFVLRWFERPDETRFLVLEAA